MAHIDSELAHLMALADRYAHGGANAHSTAAFGLKAALAALLQRAHAAESELQSRCDRTVSHATAPETARMQPQLPQLVDWVAEAMEAGIACGDPQMQGTSEHQARFDKMSASCRRLIEGISAAVAQRDTLLAALPDVESVAKAALVAQPSPLAVAYARCVDLFDPLVQPQPRQMAWLPTEV